MAYLKQKLAAVRAENLKQGRCPDCGGCGVVADMKNLHRDVFANRPCRKCRGTGKLPDPPVPGAP